MKKHKNVVKFDAFCHNCQKTTEWNGELTLTIEKDQETFPVVELGAKIHPGVWCRKCFGVEYLEETYMVIDKDGAE